MTVSRGASLTLKRRGADRLVLSPSLSFRILFALLLAAALFILVSSLASGVEPSLRERTVRASLILAVIMGAGVLYNDCWIFDRRRGTAESRFGIFLLCRRRSVPLEELRAVRVHAVRRMTRLVVVDGRGSELLLDSARGTRREALEQTGGRIAEFCGVPFTAS